MKLLRQEISVAHLYTPFHVEDIQRHLLRCVPCYLMLGSMCMSTHLSLVALILLFHGSFASIPACMPLLHLQVRSLCMLYLPMILAIGKTPWNVLWKSVGNIFSLSFQQNNCLCIESLNLGYFQTLAFEGYNYMAAFFNSWNYLKIGTPVLMQTALKRV